MILSILFRPCVGGGDPADVHWESRLWSFKINQWFWDKCFWIAFHSNTKFFDCQYVMIFHRFQIYTEEQAHLVFWNSQTAEEKQNTIYNAQLLQSFIYWRVWISIMPKRVECTRPRVCHLIIVIMIHYIPAGGGDGRWARVWGLRQTQYEN